MILIYIIKSSLCLAVLFTFYKIVLENKAMHQFKRFYLLASLIFSFTLPLITFTYTIDALPEPEPLINAYDFDTNPITAEPITGIQELYILPSILWSIYGLGVLIFGVRFILNLVRLKRKISASQQIKETHFTLSLVKQPIIPHSFLQWIFLNKTAYNNQQIAPEVLAHEATHVRQKHSLDILFIELLQVFFWFNPLIWISKKSIKLNHEFLADQGVISNKCNIAIYQNILLSYASNAHHTALESPINYSLTKKRILMLSKTLSRKRAALSLLILIPVLAGCVFLFNNKIVAQPQSSITQLMDNDATTDFINTRHPSQADIEKWSKTESYTIYLDDVRISNKEILEYHPDDLPYHYYKKTNKPGIEVHIWTNPYWQYKNKIGFQESANYSNLRKVEKTKYVKGDSITLTVTDTGQKVKMVIQDSINDTKYESRIIKDIKEKLQEADKLNLKNILQKPASAKEIANYNTWAKKINTQNSVAEKAKNGEYAIVKLKDIKKYKSIYNRMTQSEKNKAEPWPSFPPPPPPPAPVSPKPIEKSSKAKEKAKNKNKDKSKVVKHLAQNDRTDIENQKDAVKEKSKFSFSRVMIEDALDYQPDLSLHKSKGYTLVKDTYTKTIIDDIKFYKGTDEISTSQALELMKTKDYFMDDKGFIEGTSTKKIVFTKKPWLKN